MGTKQLQTFQFQDEFARLQNPRSSQLDSEQSLLHLSPLTILQHSIGNRAMRRLLIQRHPHNSAILIQREVGEEENLFGNDEDLFGEQEPASPGDTAADSGTIDIQPVQPDRYDVTGATLAEVSTQLDPTEWGHCTYRYVYDPEITNGRATRVDITLELTIRMPRWQGERWDNASRAVKAEWRRMISALQAHEDRHAAIARQWAPTFRERLLNQRQRDLQQRFNAVRQQVRERQDEFDQETEHGRTQGVSLDISIG